MGDEDGDWKRKGFHGLHKARRGLDRSKWNLDPPFLSCRQPIGAGCCRASPDSSQTPSDLFNPFKHCNIADTPWQSSPADITPIFYIASVNRALKIATGKAISARIIAKTLEVATLEAPDLRHLRLQMGNRHCSLTASILSPHPLISPPTR